MPTLSQPHHEPTRPNEHPQQKPHTHFIPFTPHQQFPLPLHLPTHPIYTYNKQNRKLHLPHAFQTKPPT
ncbi:beta-propeller fold lactonase family protein, partial [Bacillus altitudinis]|uniref:beta-propeller fold lactonase family protein n=1 Tax=Bacillus altitudinis TaxID=293387 RepID=UPI003B51BC42